MDENNGAEQIDRVYWTAILIGTYGFIIYIWFKLIQQILQNHQDIVKVRNNMSSRKKANKTFRHGWASEGKAKKEREINMEHKKQIKENIDYGDRNGKVLADFVKYATSHPRQRFWQLLRNWSGASYILFSRAMPESCDIGSNEEVDTFYWEGKEN